MSTINLKIVTVEIILGSYRIAVCCNYNLPGYDPQCTNALVKVIYHLCDKYRYVSLQEILISHL